MRRWLVRSYCLFQGEVSALLMDLSPAAVALALVEISGSLTFQVCILLVEPEPGLGRRGPPGGLEPSRDQPTC
jgi:hypothetical protein